MQPGRPSNAAAQGSAIQTLGVLVLVVFVFLAISRAHEIFSLGRLHPFLLLSPIVAVLIFVGGNVGDVLRHRIGKAMVFLTVWIMAAAPFSIWRGGSVWWLRDRWLLAVLTFFAVASLIGSIRQFYAVVGAIGSAIMLITASAAIWGADATDGRFSLGSSPSLANPNDFACYLLFGVACVAMPLLRKSASIFRKAIALFSVALIFLMTMKTGSRMAILTLGILSLATLWKLPLPKKVMMVLAMMLLGIAGTAMMSADSRGRILTLFSSRSERVTLNEASALESTAVRRKVLWTAITGMFKHPVFGIGPGVFTVYSSAELTQGTEKQSGAWLNAHNSYAQMGAEAGIPAFLAYVTIILLSVRVTLRTYRVTTGRLGLSDISSASLVALFSLISYACTSTFSNFHDGLLLPVLAGMAISLDRVAGAALAVASEPVPAAAVVNWPPRPSTAYLARRHSGARG